VERKEARPFKFKFKKLWFLIGPKGPHTCGNLGSINSITMCVIIDRILVLTPMPMLYYIFPNAFPEPKPRRGDVLSMLVCVCVSPPPSLPSTALLRCTASCALGRGPVYEGVAAGCGVPVRLPVGLPLPPALAWRSHNWQLERPATETRAAPPVCVYRRGGVTSPSK
jgi:hypothetical protein